MQREPIRLQHPRPRPEHFLIVRLVPHMGDDRRAFMDVGPDTAQVIPVMMRVDDEADRLLGNEPVHLANHGQRSRLVERRLDHHDVVAELDGEAVVAAAGQ